MQLGGHLWVMDETYSVLDDHEKPSNEKASTAECADGDDKNLRAFWLKVIE